jgi:hypothetical protein
MANINLSWIVKLVLIMVAIGVMLGVSVYHNINADKPAAVATPSAAASQPGPAAQPSVMVPYINPAAIDRVLYPFPEMLKLAQQFGDLTERQNRINEQRVEIAGREQAFAVQQRIGQQEAEQNLALRLTLAHVAMGAGLVMVGALAMSMISYATFAGWGRLKVDRARAAQITAQTQAAALNAKASDEQEQLNKIWRAVGDLTRQHTQLKNEFAAVHQAAPGFTPTVPSHSKYDDLPLAG